MEYIDLGQLMEKILDAVREAGSQKDLAEAVGITPQYLSDILSGKRNPGWKLLEHLGYDSLTVYIRLPDTEAERRAAGERGEAG